MFMLNEGNVERSGVVASSLQLKQKKKKKSDDCFLKDCPFIWHCEGFRPKVIAIVCNSCTEAAGFSHHSFISTFLLSFKSEITTAVQPVLTHKHIFCFGSTSLTKTSSFFVGVFFFQLDLQLLIFESEKRATLPASCDHMTLSVFFTSFQTARLAARAIIKAKTMQVHMHAQ